MMNALKNPANRAWVVLIIATLITWYLGEVGAAIAEEIRARSTLAA
mgnify:CR=1 FL=1